MNCRKLEAPAIEFIHSICVVLLYNKIAFYKSYVVVFWVKFMVFLVSRLSNTFEKPSLRAGNCQSRIQSVLLKLSFPISSQSTFLAL